MIPVFYYLLAVVPVKRIILMGSITLSYSSGSAQKGIAYPQNT